MQQTPIQLAMDTVPAVFHSWMRGAQVFDSSSSPDARVYYLQKGTGYYLKSASKGALKAEADMTVFLYERQMATEVLFYLSGDRDWLLTRAVSGQDCTSEKYLSDPVRLCDTTAQQLRTLHSIDFSECPVQNRTETYLSTVAQNIHTTSDFYTTLPKCWQFSSLEEAQGIAAANAHLLKCDTLIHGDYCLPNIILDNWRFSKFIDLGNGGVGDKHIDLFWGIWSLGFNLKTDAYMDRFLDAYGREDMEPEMLRIIAAFECFG